MATIDSADVHLSAPNDRRGGACSISPDATDWVSRDDGQARPVAALAQGSAVQQGKDRTGILAYVLDDEPSVAEIVSHALTKAAAKACPFTDPVWFMMRTRACPPDLVVLDLSLGGTNAVEIMRQLEILDYRGKVLLMSGRFDGALHEAERIGGLLGLAMLTPLLKPFRLADLAQRVAEFATVAGERKAGVPG